MFRESVKIALRSLLRHKLYSTISISGLAVGIACAILFGLHAYHEWSYDRFYTDADRIFRIVRKYPHRSGGRIVYQSRVSGPLAEEARSIPEVTEVVRVWINEKWSGAVVHYGDLSADNGFCHADPNIFEFFDFAPLVGDPAALSDPNAVFISERMRAKYFKDEDPLGKVIFVRFVRYQGDYVVAGVIPNPRINSSIPIDFLASSRRFDSVFWASQRWATPGIATPLFTTFLKLESADRRDQIEESLIDLARTHFPPQERALIEYELQPLTRIHLYSNLDYGIRRTGGRHGNIETIRYLALVIGLILLIACFNFVNLATATASLRYKEVGIRKTVGALRTQLIGQFLIEGYLQVLIAAVLAAGIAIIFLPHLEQILLRDIPMVLPSLPALGLAGLALFVIAHMATVFPSVYQSRLSASEAFHSSTDLKPGRTSLRKTLIVFQFAVSTMFIAGTAIIDEQLDFVLSKDVGYNREALIGFSIRKPAEQLPGPVISWSDPKTGNAALDTPEHYRRLHTVAEAFRSVPGVISAARSVFMPPTFGGFQSVFSEDRPEHVVRCQKTIFDEHFLETYQISLLAGRNFSRDFPTDPKEALLVNESAVEALRLTDPVGTRLVWSSGLSKTIVGVIKDFHTRPLREPLPPLMVEMRESRLRTLTLRVQMGDFPRLRERLEAVWRSFVTDAPFTPSWIEDRFARQYGEENRLGQVFTIMAGLSIFISCLGLLGLSTFTIERRTKEIGIRKVLGGTVTGLTTMVSWGFLRLVVVSSLIAIPVAYHLMEQWLSSFAYRIDVGPITYLASIGVTAGIALLTIGYKAYRAADRNPVDSLRYE